LEKIVAKKKKIQLFWPNFIKIAYNMKGCLRFFYFHIAKFG
jgi:hypothetical protein